MKRVFSILICIYSLVCFGQDPGDDILTKSYAVPDSMAKAIGVPKEENPQLYNTRLNFRK